MSLPVVSETVPARATYSRSRLDLRSLTPLAQSIAGGMSAAGHGALNTGATTSVFAPAGATTSGGCVRLTHLVAPIEPNGGHRAQALRRESTAAERQRQAMAAVREVELAHNLKVLENAKAKTRAALQQALSSPLTASDAANQIVAQGPPVRQPEPSREGHARFLTGTRQALVAKATSRQLALQFRHAEARFAVGPLKRHAKR